MRMKKVGNQMFKVYGKNPTINVEYERRRKQKIKEKTPPGQLNQYELNRRNKFRAYIDKYLDTHPCVDCGQSNKLCLEFDHVRGYKKDGVRHIRSIPKLVAEIAKCDVRCANCHTIRHRSSL